MYEEQAGDISPRPLPEGYRERVAGHLMKAWPHLKAIMDVVEEFGCGLFTSESDDDIQLVMARFPGGRQEGDLIDLATQDSEEPDETETE